MTTQRMRGRPLCPSPGDLAAHCAECARKVKAIASTSKMCLRDLCVHHHPAHVRPPSLPHLLAGRKHHAVREQGVIYLALTARIGAAAPASKQTLFHKAHVFYVGTSVLCQAGTSVLCQAGTVPRCVSENKLLDKETRVCPDGRLCLSAATRLYLSYDFGSRDAHPGRSILGVMMGCGTMSKRRSSAAPPCTACAAQGLTTCAVAAGWASAGSCPGACRQPLGKCQSESTAVAKGVRRPISRQVDRTEATGAGAPQCGEHHASNRRSVAESTFQNRQPLHKGHTLRRHLGADLPSDANMARVTSCNRRYHTDS